ncbi:MAG: hypothetical protein CMJ29_00075 [Phycisphaerae bacterium]|nr:hypothetical protein [Phycisphaerae bacterium]|tara:strand:- start:49 stop:456 length:408 start_codon:yes stop_codon:yes gene_type:complete
MIGTETVQLRHVEPGGDAHIDWMLSHDEHSLLVTIKLKDRLEALEAGSRMTGIFLGDHRRRYLTYEGPLSDGRGEVSRVASGRLLRWVRNGDNWWITVHWDDGPLQHLQVTIEAESASGASCEITAHQDLSGAEG